MQTSILNQSSRAGYVVQQIPLNVKKKLFYSVKSGEESDMSPVIIISAYKWTSALQVKYKSNQNQKPEGSSDLPNLLQLEHVLHASKLQSNVRHHHSPA